MSSAQNDELRSYEERRAMLARDIRDLETGHWQHFQSVGSGPWVEISDELLADYRWELRSIERYITVLKHGASQIGRS